MVTILQ
jgi:hypothetical protein